MRILLLGEYSGFYFNLKEGLTDLGHEVVLCSNGDGYKNISANVKLNSEHSGLYAKIDRRIKLLRLIQIAKGFDVVQLINPFELKLTAFPIIWFYKKLKKENGKFFLSAAGMDAYYWQHAGKKLKYTPFKDHLTYDLKKPTSIFETPSALNFNKSVANICDGIIPNNFEYECGYRHEEKLLKTLPIPINTANLKYEPNMVKGKIKVFHGLSRYGLKGTRFIEDAFKILSEKYSDQLELNIKGHMPLDEYLDFITRSNIIIDQVFSYSAGMNALFAMSKGKVVLGGSEPESHKALSTRKSPVLNIKPNVESIVKSVEYFIKNPKEIERIGFASRKFVEKYHDHKKIAQMYINAWS
tara:strand:+ start:1023 stop:2084 length:1062 start_codon:yes stop_codon:yes gene_type:complete